HHVDRLRRRARRVAIGHRQGDRHLADLRAGQGRVRRGPRTDAARRRRPAEAERRRHVIDVDRGGLERDRAAERDLGRPAVELFPTPMSPERLNPAGPVIVYLTVSSERPGASWRSRSIWPWFSGWTGSTGSVAQPVIHAATRHGPTRSPPRRIALGIVVLFM